MKSCREEPPQCARAVFGKEGSLRFLDALVAGAPLPMARVDLKGSIIFANKAALDFLEYPLDELRQLSFAQFAHPEEPEDDSRLFSDLVCGKCERYSVWKRYVTKNGKDVWAHVHASLLRDDQRRPAAVWVVCEDVTEQRRVEESLLASESRYRSLFEHSGVPMWEADHSRIKRFLGERGLTTGAAVRDFLLGDRKSLTECLRLVRVLDVNQAAVEFYEARDKAELMQSLSLILPEGDAPAIVEQIAALADGRRSFEIEAKSFSLRQKRLIHLNRMTVPPGFEDTWSRVLFSIVDIGERMMYERNLLKYQEELRSLSAQLLSAEESERRRIAEGLHDDVAQTLALSKIKLEILKKKLRPAEQQQAVDELLGLLAKALASVRSSIFEISSPILYELGPGPAIQWLCERVQEEHGLKVECRGGLGDLSNELSVYFFQSVRELLRNAVKHAGADRVEVDMQVDGREACVTVKDNGIGFKEDALRRETSKSFGLFNLRERTSWLGGVMEIRAEQGTRVTLRVPTSTRKGL